MQYMAYKKSGRTKKKKHGMQENHKRGSGRPKRAVPVVKAKVVVKETMKPDTNKVSK